MSEITPSQSSDYDEYELEMTATSSAQGDGQETNSATALLSRNGVPQHGQSIEFVLSGNARFSNGGVYQTPITDDQGKAIVYFTDTLPEKVEVSSHYGRWTVVDYSTFGARSYLYISARVLNDYALNNGVDSNQLLYSVYNLSGTPVSGAVLEFRVSNGASLSAQVGVTDNQGQFQLSIFSRVAGTAEVGAQIRGGFGNNYTIVTFRPSGALYQLVSTVYPQPNNWINVIHRLTNIATGQGVADQRLLIYIGNPRQFLHYTLPTRPDGSVLESYGCPPGSVVTRFAVWADDRRVESEFTTRNPL